MSRYNDLRDAVLNWAGDREILENSTPMAQALKTLEEVQELLTALHNNAMTGGQVWHVQDVADAYGDILVTLIIGSEIAGLDLVDCLSDAYVEIKDRRGRLDVSGVFIKEVEA